MNSVYPVCRSTRALRNALIAGAAVTALFFLGCGNDKNGSAVDDDGDTSSTDGAEDTETSSAPELDTATDGDAGVDDGEDQLLQVSGETDIESTGETTVETSGGVESVDGREGDGLFFDGEDDYVTVSLDAYDSSDITLSAWVKPEGPQQPWAPIIDFYGDHGVWLGVSEDGAHWQFWVRNRVTAAIPGQYPAVVSGRWQHVAGVFDEDGGRILLFINGALAAETELEWWENTATATLEARALPTPEDIFIGGNPDGHYFNGIIDDASIWRIPLEAEVLCEEAGGAWADGVCSFEEPVAEIMEDPCLGLTERIVSMRDAIRADMDDAAIDAAEEYVSQYETDEDDIDPEAQAWMGVGLIGLLTADVGLQCLGALEAAVIEPENPVVINNATACLIELERFDAANNLVTCNLQRLPDHAEAVANQAYISAVWENNLEKALDEMERAAELAPDNPEWRYQAMRYAEDTGDMDKAASYLLSLPNVDDGYPGGYRGADSSNEDEVGSYCCPCDGSLHDSVSECTDNCNVTLACFVNICVFSTTCEQVPPFLFELKLCYPPLGVQVCISVSSDGTVTLQGGFSVGFASVSAGIGYNMGNNHISIVAGGGGAFGVVNGSVGLSYDTYNGNLDGQANYGGEGGIVSFSRYNVVELNH